MKYLILIALLFLNLACGVHPRYTKSYVLEYTQLAKQGDKEAQYQLGKMYDYAPQDPRLNVSWFIQLAELKINGRKITNQYLLAVYWYTQAAKQGHREAQYQLGDMYDYGYNGSDFQFPSNDKLTKYWYTQAAKQGHKEAQYQLGDMYNGKWNGKWKNPKLAVYWYTQAAKQKHVWAQYYLAEMYVNGSGTPKDLKKAKYWHTQAAKQNNEFVKEKLDVLFTN